MITFSMRGPSWPWSYGSLIYYYLCNKCLSPLRLRVRIPLRQGRLNTTLCDKVWQWLVTGRWFSPGTPVSSTNKTDRYDMTEILLKVALLYRYIMFGRGICKIYQSRDEKFPEPNGKGNLVSRQVFFANTPLKHDTCVYLFNYTKYYLEHWLNK